MIEIRTYEGDAAELSRFTQRVWIEGGIDKMPLPIWNEEYFEWQLLSELAGRRNFLVAAYDGARLVGCLPCERFRFRVDGCEMDGTMGSWLTADPDYKRQGIASLLVEEQRRRHAEQEAKFMIGYAAPGTSGGPFWRQRPDARILGRIGFWVRILDPRVLARWSPSLGERLAIRLLGPLLGAAPPSGDGAPIRPYREGDLPSCLGLAHRLLSGVEVGYLWSAERLAHQFQFRDLPRTLVWDEGGGVRGFVNYYPLEMMGRFRQRMAVIDLLAFGDLPQSSRRRLVAAALGQMSREEIHSVIMLRLGCYGIAPLIANRFVPLPGATCELVFAYAAPGLAPGRRRHLLLHWR